MTAPATATSAKVTRKITRRRRRRPRISPSLCAACTRIQADARTLSTTEAFHDETTSRRAPSGGHLKVGRGRDQFVRSTNQLRAAFIWPGPVSALDGAPQRVINFPALWGAHFGAHGRPPSGRPAGWLAPIRRHWPPLLYADKSAPVARWRHKTANGSYGHGQQRAKAAS
jgi:hypothetical protein